MNSAERPAQSGTFTRRAASYERVLQEATLAVVECTAEGRISRWNEGAARLFGYSEEEALGRPLAGTLLTEDDGGDGDDWRGLLADGASPARTWTGVRKDGSACACAWSCHRIDDEQGRPALVCIGHEIAPRTEAAIRHDRDAMLLRALVDNLDVIVWAIEPDGTFRYHEGKALAPAGLRSGQYVGHNVFDLYRDQPGLEMVRQGLAGVLVEEMSHTDGRSWNNWTIPIRSDDGQVSMVLGVSLDVTDVRRLEQEAQARLEVLERQQRVIRELSTPILEVWEGVLALPMIGVVDCARTTEIMDALLQAVSRRNARFAILDLTGVDAVDTDTASSLIHLIRAIQLLGAEGIITGIRPTVAQTLVTLGVDLGAITTLGNLRAGLRHCIARMTRGSQSPTTPTTPKHLSSRMGGGAG